MKFYSIGMISGYFNPLHTGHLDYIEEGFKRCDLLYAIVNNDDQVKLKGSKQFMDQKSRVRIIRALKPVYEAVISIDSDLSVRRSIRHLYEQHLDDPFVGNIFFMNGGDRKQENIPEVDVCKELGINMIYNVGGTKTESSSSLLTKIESSV